MFNVSRWIRLGSLLVIIATVIAYLPGVLLSFSTGVWALEVNRNLVALFGVIAAIGLAIVQEYRAIRGISVQNQCKKEKIEIILNSALKNFVPRDGHISATLYLENTRFPGPWRKYIPYVTSGVPFEPVSFRWNQGIVGKVVQSGKVQPIRLNRLSERERLVRFHLDPEQEQIMRHFNSALGLPIFKGKRIVAVLEFDSPTHMHISNLSNPVVATLLEETASEVHDQLQK